MNKEQMMKDIDSAFARHVEDIRKSVRTSQEMTRDAPGRIESRYDTSREETGWLATGQAAMLAELEHGYAAFKALGSGRKSIVQIGALFEAVSITGSFSVRCLVCPSGGGFECSTAEGPVTLISPESPLAQSALGCCANDMFTVNGRIDYIIREVA
ncbi:MAG: hypothetical protein II840_07585 [Kiritimatiellae bacterium]|nr:hypothetical protein [Kiritimatiellia bacterium]